MKLRFAWTTTHNQLEVRIITMAGARVNVLDTEGRPRDLPVIVRNGQELTIDPNYIPRGESTWLVRVFVPDVTGTQMTGLNIVATGGLVVASGGTVNANAARDFEKTIVVPLVNPA